jgi:hypothetical protein
LFRQNSKFTTKIKHKSKYICRREQHRTLVGRVSF